MKKISIIIPVYNMEKFIPRCLESLVNQTLKDIEIIVVNDGSTDNSLELLNEYKNKDSRIVVIDKANSGVSEARNTGIKKATGEYIGFVDPDDWIKKEMYEKLYNTAKDNDCDVVMCNFIKSFNDGRYENEKIEVTKNKVIEKPLLNELNAINLCLSVWKGIYKRSLIIDNNIQFPKEIIIGEDKIFNMIALGKCNRFYYVDGNYYYYYYNNNGAVRTYRKNFLEQQLALIEKQEEILKNMEVSNMFIEKLNAQYIDNILLSIYNQFNCNEKNSFIDNLKFSRKLVYDDRTQKYLNRKYSFTTSMEKVRYFCFKNKLYIFLSAYYKNYAKKRKKRL